MLVDEGVPLEFGRDMWTLESHLGVQDACVLSEAPVSPLLISKLIDPPEGTHFLVDFTDEWSLKAV